MMQRRDVLRIGISAALSSQLVLLVGCTPEAPEFVVPASEAPETAEVMTELLRSLDGIDFIGPVCRQRLGGSLSLEELGAWIGTRPPDGLIDDLQAQIREDYAQDRTEDVEGWVLSRTECVMAAAAAKVQGMLAPRERHGPELREEAFAAVIDWGPSSTLIGEIFNPIGNGRGGFWIRLHEPVPGSTRLALGGQEIMTHVFPDVITGSLEPEYMERVIAEAGTLKLELFDTARGVRQVIGEFAVREPPPRAILADGSESTAFCPVQDFGPREAPQGESFNRQDDGSSALWIKVDCTAALDTVVLLGGETLPTSVHPDLVTARIPHYAALSMGEHPIALHDPESGETLSVGSLTIR